MFSLVFRGLKCTLNIDALCACVWGGGCVCVCVCVGGEGGGGREKGRDQVECEGSWWHKDDTHLPLMSGGGR